MHILFYKIDTTVQMFIYSGKFVIISVFNNVWFKTLWINKYAYVCHILVAQIRKLFM